MFDQGVSDWVQAHVSTNNDQWSLVPINPSILDSYDVLFKQVKVQPNCPLTLHGQHVLFVNFTGQVRVSKKSCAVMPGAFALCGKGKKTVRILNSSLPTCEDILILADHFDC